MKTYAIFDAAGEQIGSQTWPDEYAPILLRGQSSVPDLPGDSTLVGTFTGAGVGASLEFSGTVNINIAGTFVATVQLERSFDSGTTWVPATLVDGTVIAFTGPASTRWSEPESGVSFRLRCTSYSSGSVVWRLSQ